MRRVVQEATLLITVVVLALVVWFVIADAENEEIESRLGFSLQVDVRELGPDLVVVGEPLPVSLTVIGREEDLESARPDHFRATVSLRNRAAGRHSLPVRVETLEGEVRVRAVQPETAVVILQETVERQVPVVLEPINLPPLGFRVGVAQVLPETAFVSGIASEVDAVEAVVARLDLGDATGTIERNVLLEARTAAGGAVTQVIVNPRFAQVRVPIEQELFRRTASILPNVIGAPAEGYRVRAVRAMPATVDVLVSLEMVDDQVEVPTEDVDISGGRSDVIAEVALAFAEGAAPAGDSETSARVLVVIEPVITTVQLPVEVVTVGVGDSLELVFASSLTVRLTLRGPVALISNLEGPLSPIEVDLATYAAGRHLIELNWTPPQGIELVELRPSQIMVALTPMPQPEPPPEAEAIEDDEDKDAGDDQLTAEGAQGE